MLRILQSFIWIVVVTSFVPANAQVDFKVNVENRVVALNGYVRIQYRLEYANEVSSFTPPPFADFTTIQGPEQMTGMQNINGQVSNYSTFSYILKPAKKGRFIFPPAKATIDGKVVQSPSVTIEVNDHGAPLRFNNDDEEPEILEEFILHKDESAVEKINRNVFVRLEVNKKSVFIGEPIVATYKLYTRVNSESRITKRPSLNGFSVFDMMEPDAPAVLNENYKGREYNVYILRKAQLYPLREGEFELESMEVENTVSFIKEEYAIDEQNLIKLLRTYGEDGLRPDAWVREVVNISSQPVKIMVKGLPEGMTAAGFNGAVGSFTIAAEIPQKKIRQDDVVNLKVTVSGSGNLPIVSTPDVQWPDSLETYETTVFDQLNKQTSPISGKKIFTIPFSTRQLGRVELPPIVLTSFNPGSGKYETATTTPLLFNVEPAEKKANKWVAKVIPAIKAPASKPWLAGLVIFIVAFIAVTSIYYYNKRKTPIVLKPFPKTIQKNEIPTGPAAEVAQKVELSPALPALIEQSKSEDLYREIEMTVRRLLDEKYDIPRHYNLSSIELQLANKGVVPADIRAIRELLEDCALSKYTPFVLEDKMNTDFITCRDLLVRLQQPVEANQ